jgi:hypothetical protein
MGWSRCALGILLAVALGSPKAQAIQLLNANCETYTRIAASCHAPVEVDHVSPTFFVVWADSSNPVVICGDYESIVNTMSEQVTAVLADSLHIHEISYSYRLGSDAQSSFARSDAVLTFRVGVNHPCKYRIRGTLWTENPTTDGHDGVAKASFALTRVDTGTPSVIATWAVQAGPNSPPTRNWRGLVYDGALAPGDYVLEGHTSAENPNSEGTTQAIISMYMSFRDAPTAVSATSWSALKALYR